MPAGSALLYLGSLWHGGGANHTEQAAPRRRAALRGVVAAPGREPRARGSARRRRELPERLQELLGYNIYPPFIGYVDGRHPRKLLGR